MPLSSAHPPLHWSNLANTTLHKGIRQKGFILHARMSLISLIEIHTWHLVFWSTLWLPLLLLAFGVFGNAFWALLHPVLFIKDVSASHSLPQLQLFSHFLPPHFWHRGPGCPNEILMKAWGRACALSSSTAVPQRTWVEYSQLVGKCCVITF